MAPNGVGVAAYGAALRAGANGVGPISLFDPTGFDCGIAAEVKDFKVDQILAGAEARRVGAPCRCCSAQPKKLWVVPGSVSSV